MRLLILTLACVLASLGQEITSAIGGGGGGGVPSGPAGGGLGGTYANPSVRVDVAYCPDTSVSANTITCTVNSAKGVFASYSAGESVDVLLANTVTGATTININGLGAKAVTYNGTNALTSAIGWNAGATGRLLYDGTRFVMQGIVSTGGGTPGTPVNSIQFNNPLGTFAGSANLVFYPSTTPPAAPVLATVGAAGATTYGYELVFRTPTGTSAAGPQTTIATGNAVLDGTNYVTITTPVCTIPNMTVDVWRTVGGGNVPNTGFLGNAACGGIVNDQGVDGDGLLPPTVDSTVGVYDGGSLVSRGHSALGALGIVDFNESGGEFNYPAVLAITEHINLPFTCGNFDFCSVAGIAQYVDIANSGLNASITALGIDNNVSIGNNTPSVTPFSSATAAKNYLSVYENVLTDAIADYNLAAVATNSTVAGNLFGTYSKILTLNSPTISGDVAAYYATSSISGGTTVTGKTIAWFNTSFAPDFAWYSEGGTNHLETGDAGTPGMEIEAFSGQSANLFQTLASDGTTVWSGFDADGRNFLRTVAFVDLGSPATPQEVSCSNCTVTSAIDDTCAGSGSGAFAFRIAGAWKCNI